MFPFIDKKVICSYTLMLAYTYLNQFYTETFADYLALVYLF